jgi:GT2 family glycosyltransferase
VSLVVLTWNGKHLLEECLPSVVRASEEYGGPSEIIVVDDGSSDGSAEYLRENFPLVRVVELDKNSGFQVACNMGVRTARHDIVFLLNNDILLSPDCVEPLAAHFKNEKIFAAGPLMRFQNSDSVYFSCCGVKFSRGLLIEDWAAVGGTDLCGHLSPSMYLSGGAMMFRKDVFEGMGMMDSLYHPFYCEDFDVCYRAWKKGYFILYEPRSVVYHKHSATISKNFAFSYYELVHRRNLFLLMWRNLTEPKYLFQHILFLFPRLLKRTLKGDIMELKAFLLALGRIPLVMNRRWVERNSYVRSDAEICEMLSLKNVLSSDHVFELDSEGLRLTRPGVQG